MSNWVVAIIGLLGGGLGIELLRRLLDAVGHRMERQRKRLDSAVAENSQVRVAEMQHESEWARTLYAEVLRQTTRAEAEARLRLDADKQCVALQYRVGGLKEYIETLRRHRRALLNMLKKAEIDIAAIEPIMSDESEASLMLLHKDETK